MKINGKSIVRETRNFKLARSDGSELTLKIASISVGVNRDFDLLWPAPRPPKRTTVKKDTVSGKSVPDVKEDWDDQSFLNEVAERTTLKNIYLLWRVLESDTNVQFDNKPDTIDGLRALYAEIKSSGLSEGDIVAIMKEAVLASNLTNIELDAAKQDF